MAEDKTTLTVSEGTLARFKSLKKELDEQQSSVPDHTADSFLNALLDTWEAANDGYYDTDAEAIAEAVKDELSMANEPGVEIDTQEIINRIEELESRLPPMVAEEVAEEVLSQR